MRAWIDTLGVVAQIAFRNLFASRLKTIIVGGIILFGALLVVAGNSLLDSLDASMSRSVIGSVSGHIQVYNAKSKDPLEVMGRMNMGDPDLAELDDFSRVRASLLKVPNVASVVPMGISGALVTSGNTIDLALEKLRGAVRARQDATKPADQKRQDAIIASEKAHVRQIVTVLQGDLKNAKTILDARAINQEDVDAVNRAASDAFWADFDKDPLDGLEFLENRIATQAADADLLFLNYIGTDMQSFSKAFDRLKIVDGQMLPPGKRGFLFAKRTYEDQLKLKAARRLDQIKEGLESRGETIATDLDLQRMVRENVAQVREILLQLDAVKTADFRAKLQRELGSGEADVGKLLAAFFQTDDASFKQRYEFFYRELAPSLELYRVRVGDVLTIKSFTRSGYVQSVNLPVYGTFEFQGLEKSTLAGTLNLMDLVSFRELYGFLTGDKLREIEQLQRAAAVKDISRENAEAELFGAKPAADQPGEARPPRQIEAEATPGVARGLTDLNASLGGRLKRDEARARVFPPDEVQRGVVLNAAVILKDPKLIPQTIAAIEAQGAKDGLPLKAITWQKSAGIIGQFIMLARMVLYIAILIIFVIALVIINNALVMATLERVKEIGTLRAIGAQRRFILAMLVVESLVVGLIFGGLGALLGGLVVSIVGKIGIPAKSDIWFFFFSGPRLHPFLGTSNFIAAFAIVILVSAFSSFYPAWIAMRVTPRQAMAEEGIAMSKLFVDVTIAFRSLIQHGRRTAFLGTAIASVTALLVLLTGLSTGVRETMIDTATTISTGHLNVGGFFKVTAGQAAPVVTDYKKVLAIAKEAVPEMAFAVHRGRGWAKVISDTGSMQLGVTGIDVAREPKFASVLQLVSGKLDDLTQPGTILLFDNQADKLGVKVGDALTISAPTTRGTNNTIDVRVVAIAHSLGLLSSWNSFIPIESLRALYQLNQESTGVIQILLQRKDLDHIPAIAARLRKSLEDAGYRIMTPDPRAFWFKFQSVAREDWTGQKLDITSWEDEISFMSWTLQALNGLTGVLITILLGIVIIGIMNTMWIAIRERTREIGTLRAIGMHRREVLWMFLVESLLLGLFGTIVGAAAGAAIAAGLNGLHVHVPISVQLFLMSDHLRLAIHASLLIKAIVAITLITGAAALYPSLRAARLRPVVAMQHFG